MLDVLITGGTVIDGSGSPGRAMDVGIVEDRIAAVEPLAGAEAARVIAATGLVVTPGFIDIHSHSDFTLLVDPRAVSSITQGVTLEVVGNCGYGCSVIGNPLLAREAIYGFRSVPPITWRDAGGYLEAIRRARPAINVLTLVPNGQLRLATVGLEQRPATADERARMKWLLEEALDQGAWGYSTGLEYATEVGASEDEVGDLCRVVAAQDGLYSTHTRNRDEGAVAAVEEAIRTAEQSGVRLQISHLTPRSGAAPTERAIDLVDAARSRSVDVAFDMHTRLFGTTHLKALLPPWALDGGVAAVRRRLEDSAARDRMKSFRSVITALGDWGRVVLLDHPVFPRLSRRSFADIALELGQDPFDCAYNILLADVEQLQRPMVIIHSYTEELLALTYRHPWCAIGSDATALAPDGPLADAIFHGAYTWASWFYRRMVRETGLLRPEEAIRRMTGLPASRLGLSDRGVLRPGAHADVSMFDPDAFGETGTTFEPNQFARGMAHVLVNGVAALTDGRLTDARGGAVLRRRS